jgi:BirA family transcriptional regulator, biotin operon repressor / biotin---[acetyl-CoA-carboxylase] ligase
MTTTADLERVLAAAGCAAPAQWDESTGSTNATARARAEAGDPEWTLVAAGHQLEGQGRMGRAWEDRPGAALLFSLVLRPAIDPPAAGLLPLLAGAAMAEAVKGVTAVEIRCKWPNDLLREEGKVGGILAESAVADGRLRYVILGAGVNLEPPGGVPGARGLGMDTDPLALLEAFLHRFREGYLPGSPGFAAAVVDRWSRISATLGRRVEAARTAGGIVRGTATGLDPQGGLIVETDLGPVTVHSGEVMHLR